MTNQLVAFTEKATAYEGKGREIAKNLTVLVKAVEDTSRYVNCCLEITKGATDLPLTPTSDSFIDAIAWITTNISKHAEPYVFLLSQKVEQKGILNTLKDRIGSIKLFSYIVKDEEVVFEYFEKVSSEIKKASMLIITVGDDTEDVEKPLCDWWKSVNKVAALQSMVYAFKIIYQSAYDDQHANARINMIPRFKGIINRWEHAQRQADLLCGYPPATQEEIIVNGAASRELFEICARNYSRYPTFFESGFDQFLQWCTKQYAVICAAEKDCQGKTVKNKNLYRFPCLLTFQEWWDKCGEHFKHMTIMDPQFDLVAHIEMCDTVSKTAHSKSMFGHLKKSRFSNEREPRLTPNAQELQLAYLFLAVPRVNEMMDIDMEPPTASNKSSSRVPPPPPPPPPAAPRTPKANKPHGKGSTGKKGRNANNRNRNPPNPQTMKAKELDCQKLTKSILQCVQAAIKQSANRA